MKNFKKIALGLAVTLMAFGFSAFKNEEISEKRSSHFFKYIGAPGFENDKDNWEYVTGDDIPTCNFTNDGCVIEVNDLYTTPGGSGYVLTSDVPIAIGTNNPIEDPTGMVLEARNRTN